MPKSRMKIMLITFFNIEVILLLLLLGEASEQFFYRVELLAPRPNPTLEDQASVFISPRGRVAKLYPQAPGTHFCHLLRHAWVTVGPFLFPGHHTLASNSLHKAK
jgi:hypothetical protein